MARQVFSVSQVNRYVKRTLEADPLLAGIFIEGELSNFNAHSSGHMYFTLKDEGAAISGVMFRSHAENLSFMPENGMKVIAFGQLSLYEKTGQYQLYAEAFEPAGVGGLQLAFRQLSEKLQKEGLFAQEHKREIPQFCQTVAVITSPTGAAVHDILQTIKQRNPSTKVIVLAAKVQGEDAPSDLIQAVKHADTLGADVIIIGRGGGSIEDLWAFNNELLARAIFVCKTPVISAVGHETDFTIADFVADYRAATPTAAAVAATFELAQVVGHINNLHIQLKEALYDQLRTKAQDVMHLQKSLTTQIQARMAQEWQNLSHKEALLQKVSPYAAFKRGFIQAQDETGGQITSVKNLTVGQKIDLTFADGTAKVSVLESSPKNA